MSRVADALERAALDNQVPATTQTPRVITPPIATPARELPAPGAESTFRIPSSGQRAGHLAVFRGFANDTIEKLAVVNGAAGAVVEEYRRLAAMLHHTQSVRGIKVVMITSAAAGEGKTLTSSNLALTLSESYQRQVLLVDCDLRKPYLDTIFQVENSAGVIQAVRNGASEKVPLIEVSSKLKLLLSGGIVADPMTILSSARLRHLFRDASEVFDWVIVDTPPAAFLPDCNLLADAIDAAVLVITAFETPYPLAQRAVEAIGREKILGTLMNRAERDASAKYYEAYYSYNYK